MVGVGGGGGGGGGGKGVGVSGGVMRKNHEDNAILMNIRENDRLQQQINFLQHTQKADRRRFIIVSRTIFSNYFFKLSRTIFLNFFLNFFLSLKK